MHESTPSTRRSAVAVAMIYGVACHVAFVGGVGIMMVVLFSGMTRAWGNLPTPWSWVANAALLLQFPVLHTALLSRRGSAVMRRLVPAGIGVPMLSTTYALIASLQTAALFLLWTPGRHVLWQATGPLLALFDIAYATAWLLLGKSIYDAGFALQTGLLGWRAVVRNRPPAYPPMPTRGLFAWCRQPIYLSFALTLWTVPTITTDGIIVSIVLTAYCLIGPLFKEARFARRFGPAFAAYRRATPYWLPLPRWRRRASMDDAPAE